MSAIDWSTEAAALRVALDAKDPARLERIIGEGVHARLAALGAHYDTERAARAAAILADETLFASEFAGWITPMRARWAELDLAARYVEQLTLDARALLNNRFIARTRDGVDVILAPTATLDAPSEPVTPGFDDCLARSEDLDAAPTSAARTLLSAGAADVLRFTAKDPGIGGLSVQVGVTSVVAGRATITARLGDYVETFEGIVTSGERIYLGDFAASRLVAAPVLLAQGELAVAPPAALADAAGGWLTKLLDRAALAAKLQGAAGSALDVLSLARARFEEQWAARPAWTSRIADAERELNAALAASVAMRAMLSWVPA